jgi:hypothetical protein
MPCNLRFDPASQRITTTNVLFLPLPAALVPLQVSRCAQLTPFAYLCQRWGAQSRSIPDPGPPRRLLGWTGILRDCPMESCGPAASAVPKDSWKASSSCCPPIGYPLASRSPRWLRRHGCGQKALVARSAYTATGRLIECLWAFISSPPQSRLPIYSPRPGRLPMGSASPSPFLPLKACHEIT